VSTPEDSGHPDRGNPVLAEPSPPISSIRTIPDPDNPPWGLLVASLVWLASVVLTLIIPQLCALPYVLTNYRGISGGPTKETLLSDKTFVLLLVIGLFVAQLITLAIAWAVVTKLGKLSFKKTLGLSWPANFGALKSIGLAFLLFLIAMLILKMIGGQDNDLQRILNSSRAAALVIAFIAAATAPLIEEVVYRGLLYSALQRLAGPLTGVIVVTTVFAGLHVLQYWPDAGAIVSISLLSLVLTMIRARTGRLLPCYVIHLVFNGIQSILIITEPYIRALYESWRPKPVTGVLHTLLTLLFQ
jgi:membrane protease YdiL (CAAX protease family)